MLSFDLTRKQDCRGFIGFARFRQTKSIKEFSHNRFYKGQKKLPIICSILNYFFIYWHKLLVLKLNCMAQLTKQLIKNSSPTIFGSYIWPSGDLLTEIYFSVSFERNISMYIYAGAYIIQGADILQQTFFYEQIFFWRSVNLRTNLWCLIFSKNATRYC